MRNDKRRRLLHVAGIVCLIAFVFLAKVVGVIALVALVLALGCFITSGFIKPDHKAPGHPYETPYEVRFDDAEVRVFFKGELHKKIAWADIDAVGVKIDDSFLPAPWWILFADAETQCFYPSEAKGGMDMLTELQRRLPGFDNRAVIEAMGLMEGGRLVWSKRSVQA